MLDVLFIGAKATAYDFQSNGKQVKGTSYQVFFGLPIDEKDGTGYRPMKFKVPYDTYKDVVNSVGYGSDMSITYEQAYDKNGNEKNILTSYKY